MKYWFIFALSAALFWGAYVPTIALGQTAFGEQNPNRSFRAFLFIGIAYFVIAILVPGWWLLTHKLPETQDGGFTSSGAWLSTVAGVLGAAGALCVVFALRNAALEGKAAGVGGAYLMYVAPVVFAGAPIVNVLISWVLQAFQGKAHAPNPLFIVGLVVSVIGVVLVLLNSPASHATPTTSPTTITVAPTTGSSSPSSH